MKKFMTLVLALMMLFAFTACGGEDQQPSTDVDVQQSSAADTENVGSDGENEVEADAWYFEVKGVKIFMNADGAETVAALGDPISYFEDESCAGIGMDKTYTYSGFELMTYQDETDGKDKVSSVYFIDDSVKTVEGVRVGDTVADVMDAYACEYEEGMPQIALTKGNCTIYFLVSDGIVTSIEYVANDTIGG